MISFFPGYFGWLGNQMFQYAATFAASKRINQKCAFPENEPNLFELFTLSADKIQRPQGLIYQEPHFHYAPIPQQDDLTLHGYFQSEKHFAHNRQEILDLFRLQDAALSFLDQKYSEIINNKKFTSVHIRRGDYLKYADFHAIMGKEYYDEAMSRFPKSTKFVFFSDDIEWCKETFGSRHIYIENQEDILDLYLMSKIKNNIIANSSFSWWGAWLSELEDKKVLTPPVWFGPKNTHLTMKDLIPESWEMVK